MLASLRLGKYTVVWSTGLGGGLSDLLPFFTTNHYLVGKQFRGGFLGRLFSFETDAPHFTFCRELFRKSFDRKEISLSIKEERDHGFV